MYSLQTRQINKNSHREQTAKQANKISQRAKSNCNQVTPLMFKYFSNDLITCKASTLKIQDAPCSRFKMLPSHKLGKKRTQFNFNVDILDYIEKSIHHV